jgi:hypothetical protein
MRKGPALPAFFVSAGALSSLKLSSGPPGLLLWPRPDQTTPEGAGQGRAACPRRCAHRPVHAGRMSHSPRRTDARTSDQAHRQAEDALQAMEARWSADATARRSASGGVTVKTAEVLARHSLPLSGRYPRMMWLVGRGL